jgi:dihydrofolate reductase
MRISIITAVAENGVIGRGGKLPWHLSADLRRFKQLTMGHTIVMGRRTWESIGRPLPGRHTIVVSRQPNYATGSGDVKVVKSLDAALQAAESSGDDETFVVGGAEMYKEALPQADRLYVTRVLANVEGDTFFPEVLWDDWCLISAEEHDIDSKNDYRAVYQVYDRRETKR